MLREEKIENNYLIILGDMEPQARIDYKDGLWTLRSLVKNKTKLKKIAKRQQKLKFYVPEHDFEALEPGELIVSDKDKEGFIKKLQGQSWNFKPLSRWNPNYGLQGEW